MLSIFSFWIGGLSALFAPEIMHQGLELREWTLK